MNSLPHNSARSAELLIDENVNCTAAPVAGPPNAAALFDVNRRAAPSGGSRDPALSATQFHITVFGSDHSPQGERRAKSWAEFTRLFLKPLPRTLAKEALPMWSPAVFEGDYRHGDLLEGVFAVCFDVDEAPIPALAAINALAAPFRGLFHTSSSATAGCNRGRLIFCLSRQVTGSEYRAIWRVLKNSLPFPVGTAAKDPSRAWYMPREGSDGHYACRLYDGLPLDVDILLEQAGGPEPELPQAAVIAPIGFISPNELPSSYDAAVRTIGNACAAACPRTGRRNALSMALASALCTEVPFEVVPALVHQIGSAAGFGKLSKKFVASVQTVTKRRGAGAVTGWPELRREFVTVADAVNVAFPPADLFGCLK